MRIVFHYPDFIIQGQVWCTKYLRPILLLVLHPNLYGTWYFDICYLTFLFVYLYRCDVKELEISLCKRVIVTRGEKITKNLDPRAAVLSRDGLAKTVYSRLFDWLVFTLFITIIYLSVMLFKGTKSYIIS